MGKFIDLTGRVFGQLRVIRKGERYVSPKGSIKIVWLCQCDCGNPNLFSAVGAGLVSGKTISCDLCRYNKLSVALLKNLAGQTFENLLVLELIKNTPRRKNNNTSWLCVCSCGRTEPFSVKAGNLKSGNTTSCNECKKEKLSKIKFKNLLNMKFGSLIVLERLSDYVDPQGNNYTRWRCGCDCGKEASVTTGNLISGHSTSCGCRRESAIASDLKKHCVKHYGADKKENREFINPETGCPLPFDIYIPARRIFIEVNGFQHYEVNGWHFLAAKANGTTPEEEFAYQKKKDRMKRKFARKNGFYIEVDLRKIKTTEDAIVYIEDIINKL